MEIDITEFFGSADPSEFSASIAETGFKDIGKRTWAAAKEYAAREPFLKTEDDLQYFRDYMADYGAWDDAERAAWGADECNALLIQLISGDIREGGLDQAGTDHDSPEWKEYEEGAKSGRYAGNIFAQAGRIYYQLSH